MASVLKVDKLDPQSGTALEIGTSGDTVTVPTGAGLTVTDEVKTNKVSPATGTAFALGDSGDTFTVPSGATIVNSGTATGFGITATSFRPNVNPLIINGNMQIAQRATSVTGVTGGGYRTCDRMRLNPSSAGTWTVIQESLSSGAAYTAGFSKAYRIDCTTANASLGAAAHIYANMRLEGQDLQVFKKGTANAEKFTLAFWVKCNKTGTGQVNLQDVDNTRMCSGTYTISSADTWEKKVINFAADTTGALGNDNGQSLRIEWYLDSGTNYDSGTAPTAWEATATADQNASGTLNLADNTNNDWAVTAIQLEVGEYTSATIPPFQHESYGNNLLRCQRYFTKDGDAINYAADGAMGNFSFWEDAEALGYRQFPVMMRAAPTMDTPTVSSGYRFHYASTVDDVSTAGIISTGSAFNCYIYKNGVSGTKGGAGHASIIGTGAYVSFSAEL